MMKRGVTLIEILVAAFLGCLLFGVVIMIISRTNVTFNKTTDMIKAQVLLETIVQHLRSDTRAMTSGVETLENGIRFTARRGGRDTTITYQFDPQTKSVSREEAREGGTRRQTFQSKGKIELAAFRPGQMEIPGVTDLFDHINIILHIKVQEKPNMPPTRISLLGQVLSRCVQFPNPYRLGG